MHLMHEKPELRMTSRTEGRTLEGRVDAQSISPSTACIKVPISVTRGWTNVSERIVVQGKRRDGGAHR